MQTPHLPHSTAKLTEVMDERARKKTARRRDRAATPPPLDDLDLEALPPGDGGEAIRRAHAAWRRGDHVRVDELCAPLARSEDAVLRAAALNLLERTRPDPAQRVVLALCLGLFVVVVWSFGLSGCGGAEVRDDARAADAHTPSRLYPLGPGYSWSYLIDTGTGVSTLAVVRVTRVDGERYELSSGGAPNLYERRPEGLFRPGNGTWLLRAPLRLGATWPSSSGRMATVTDVRARAETGAGTFQDCVEVTETGGDDHRTIRTVYCPDVGPVIIDTSVALTTADPVHVVARLQGYAFEPI
jgi:hypothetical protein